MWREREREDGVCTVVLVEKVDEIEGELGGGLRSISTGKGCNLALVVGIWLA